MSNAYPLQWPTGRPRTPRSDRQPRYRFGHDLTVSRAIDGLIAEVERLTGEYWEDTALLISSNLRTKANGMPRSDQGEPGDPGVAVYFEYRGERRCFACDNYHGPAANIRAIAKTIEALRGIERWGSSDMLHRAFRGFTALPEAKSWREILGLNGGPVTEQAIRSAYREKAKTAHPDHGGTDSEFALLVKARDEALSTIGVS